MNYVEIRCQVSLGLFESEYFVRVNDQSAYYVNRANVQVRPAADRRTGDRKGAWIQD